MTVLKKHIPKETIVLSSYGNPFRCKFGHFTTSEAGDGSVTVRTRGMAVRDRTATTKKRGRTESEEEKPKLKGEMCGIEKRFLLGSTLQRDETARV
jgi:hypothetical protein